MILLFVPETKDLTLEQLDQVFGYGTRENMAHGLDQLKWVVKTFGMRKKGLKKPVFLHKEDPDEIIDMRGEDATEIREEQVY
jgi:hypothetical protein